MKFRNIVRSVTFSITTLLLLPVVDAQVRPVFEVAAIRPDTVGAAAGTGFDFNGVGLRITNATLQYLIRSAYRVQGDQILSAPAWLESDRFGIDAKIVDTKTVDTETGVTENISPDVFRTMLQNLLTDRFGLAIHREAREMTVYTLVVDKSGARLKEDSETGGNRLNTDMISGKATLTGTRVSMGQLTGYIGGKLGRVVVDKTGLKGVYDFTFEWDPDQSGGDSGPSIFTGLGEQLGLRLESQKNPVEVLVIDHVERPSEN